jgi:peptidoglycan hydrolase-like protein with peptidoglycan-binding domain
MLRLGSSGAAVLVLEERLVELGFDPGVVDSSFDGSTRAAVLAFQAAAGIGRDGIVGPVTWGKLDQGVRAPAPGATPAPDPQPAPTPGPETLRLGSTGSAVRALEQRLHSLGYWVDSIDDRFGSGTHHAVVALQKTAGLSRDGIVGPATRAAVDAGTRPSARTTNGHVIEIDLTRQILFVVDSGAVSWIYDTSTGRVAGTTPVGTHAITRQIDGYRYAPLGTLYRPKYFYGGVAIHGYTSVPAVPASHGCVRVTYPAMDHLWATGAAPVGTTVRVYR